MSDDTDVTKHRIVFDAGCSRMLATLDRCAHLLLSSLDPTAVGLAEAIEEGVHALSERLVNNELAHDRAMAEGGWREIGSAPKDGSFVILLCVDKETFSLEEEGTLWREGDLSVLFGKWDAPISREEFEQNTRWEIEDYGRILDPGIQTYEDYAETVLGGWVTYQQTMGLDVN